MEILILLMVAVSCAYVTAGIFNSKDRNNVFNKRSIEVTDVKKYNQSCGILVIGFGVAAEATLFVGFLIGGWAGSIATLLLIAEACGILKIYEKIEKKYIKKR